MPLRSSGIQPKLKFGFKDNKEGAKDILSVAAPPLFNKEGLISELKKTRVDAGVLSIIKEREVDLRKLIEGCKPEELGLSYKPDDVSDFLKSGLVFNTTIDNFLAEIDKDFAGVQENLFILERAIKPDFILLNDGNCPAEEIVIYLYPQAPLRFVEEVELYKLALRYPIRPPKSLAELISLALGIDEKLRVLKPKEKEQIASGVLSPWSKYLEPSLPIFSPPRTSYIPDSKTQDGMYLEEGKLRVNLALKLKHKFQYLIDNKDIFVVHSLKKGEKSNITYHCYADNLPVPNRGTLTIVADKEKDDRR